MAESCPVTTNAEDSRPRWLASARGRVLALFAALFLVALLIVPLAYLLEGATGLVGALLSFAICVVCGGLSLVVGEVFRRPEQVLYQVAFSMVLRSGIPLGICMLMYFRGGPLAEAGFVFCLLAFYVVTLAVETMIMAAQRSHTPNAVNSIKAS